MTSNKFFSFLIFFGFSLTASATDYYVSPSGNDTANGLYLQTASKGANGPFKTLARAQQAINALKISGNFNQPVNVHLAPGTYQLDAPLKLTASDSGSPGRIITWQGQAGATTIISGGKSLSNCLAAVNGVWTCATAGLGLDSIKYVTGANRIQGNLPGFNLFVNQQRLTLARWPDTDWAHIKIPANQSTTFSSFETLPVLNPGEPANAVVHIFAGNDWFDQYLPVKSIAQSQNRITLGANTVPTLTSGYRFYLLNLLSQLDAPGEWFYDQVNARILFIPPVGVTPKNIVVSNLPNLVTMNGVNYVSFQNLSFQNTTDAAINIVNSNNLVFNNLEVANSDAIGINATGSSYFSLTNSAIHDTGQTGLSLNGGNRITLLSANNLVSNNHFENFGQIILTYSPGVAVSGVGTTISNNLIEQGAGGGVTINGNLHIFEKNEVRNVCLQSADCGALYSGRDWTYRGNVISNNSFHDIYGYGLQSVDVSRNIVKYGSPAPSAAVYLDDAVSSFNISGNIFNNAGGTSTILVGGGRDNVIENNLINTNNSFAIYVDDRWPSFDWSQLNLSLIEVPYLSLKWVKEFPALAAPMEHPNWPEGNTIQNNVIITNNISSVALLLDLPSESTNLANNLYWAANGTTVVGYNILDYPGQAGTSNLETWMQLGIEKNSFIANPCATFSDTSVSFCTGSPINKIGFRTLPTDIGLSN